MTAVRRVVCIENLSRFDCVAESHNVSANGRATLVPAQALRPARNALHSFGRFNFLTIRGAASLGLRVEILQASNDTEIDAAFADLSQRPGTVLLVSTDAFFFSRHEQIVALASRHRLPAMFDNREYVLAGGLMSYGADFYNVLQLAVGYTRLIPTSEHPADLPAMPPT